MRVAVNIERGQNNLHVKGKVVPDMVKKGKGVGRARLALYECRVCKTSKEAYGAPKCPKCGQYMEWVRNL